MRHVCKTDAFRLQAWRRSSSSWSPPPLTRRSQRRPRSSRAEARRRKGEQEMEACPMPWKAWPSTNHRLSHHLTRRPRQPIGRDAQGTHSTSSSSGSNEGKHPPAPPLTNEQPQKSAICSPLFFVLFSSSLFLAVGGSLIMKWNVLFCFLSQSEICLLLSVETKPASLSSNLTHDFTCGNVFKGSQDLLIDSFVSLRLHHHISAAVNAPLKCQDI